MGRRYYRKRTVVVRPKKKWASNISSDSILVNAPDKVPWKSIVENTSQSSVPTPTILKVGNFKCSMDVSVGYSAAPSSLPHMVAYVFV